jgi:hypothetical protein
MFVFGDYFTLSTIMRGRAGASLMLSWLAASVVVSLISFAAVKSVCHECLALPSVAACEPRSGAIDVETQSNRIGRHIKERQFAGCVFYWHENNTGGN